MGTILPRGVQFALAIYGFLLSNYAKPSEIDLDALFYTGAGIASDGQEISSDEQQAFMDAYELDSIDGDLLKLSTKQINDYLKEKAGVTLSQISGKLHWLYIQKYDAYYSMVFDTNYGFFNCVSGYKTSDGTYVIQCEDNPEYGQQIDRCVVTLHQSGDSYMFVSNNAHMVY
ncbi:hypothetical protein IZU99_00335 [Oscillospiraceae bacterium CM]|nr:hypothetical protein IZU99_00335 [Oscillospiraceae bacterium CM]